MVALLDQLPYRIDNHGMPQTGDRQQAINLVRGEEDIEYIHKGLHGEGGSQVYGIRDIKDLTRPAQLLLGLGGQSCHLQAGVDQQIRRNPPKRTGIGKNGYPRPPKGRHARKYLRQGM